LRRLRVSVDAINAGAISAVDFVHSRVHRRRICDGGFPQQLCESRPQRRVAD